ncbi:MAG: Miniconductance mechanosensitive channel YbdG [Paracidovorax wautersii]|uniref:Mechanosensing system component YbdG n=1 Tax=Paracidovorax wautersii TaxID=1177982 RepID=A0A7V8JQ65_9BURK|nr:MAG: Miniconductance mechanosensitive channel YbdG [Paracidovorax wautersii]
MSGPLLAASLDKLDKLENLDTERLPLLSELEPWLQACIGLAVLVLAAYALRTLAGLVITRVFRHVRERVTPPARWAGVLLHPKVGKRLAQMLPPVIIQAGLPAVPHLHATAATVLSNVAIAMTVMYVVRVLTALLDALLENHTVHANTEASRTRSIKSYVQLGQLLLVLAGAVIMAGALIDRSPLILLSGLGAMSAVLMLVFKDTLLSFTAGLQLTTNDMLRVGDWIEMPQVGANGAVTDIALHTVKVQNWDHTFTTIPTWRLMSESFINWRGMAEAGGRRIKRTLRIDATSIGFLDEAQVAALSRVALLQDYLADKQVAVRQTNEKLRETLGGEQAALATNLRRLTNLGTFRAYAQAYLRAHPGVRQDMMLMVRTMEPTADGVPVEVYCFTATTSWVPYEGIQGDVFDHLMAVLPEFGLRMYQSPSGSDLRSGLRVAARPDAGGTDVSQ